MCHKLRPNTRLAPVFMPLCILAVDTQSIVSYANNTKTINSGGRLMMLTRRQLVVAGAGASAAISMTLGTLSAGAAPAPLITKNIPGTNERLPVIGLGTNRWVAAGDKSVIDQLRNTLAYIPRARWPCDRHCAVLSEFGESTGSVDCTIQYTRCLFPGYQSRPGGQDGGYGTYAGFLAQVEHGTSRPDANSQHGRCRPADRHTARLEATGPHTLHRRYDSARQKNACCRWR